MPADRDLAVGQRRIVGGNAVQLPHELDVQVLREPLVFVDELLAWRAETQAASFPWSDNFAEFQDLFLPYSLAKGEVMEKSP